MLVSTMIKAMYSIPPRSIIWLSQINPWTKKADDNSKDQKEDQNESIVFPDFDLSTPKVGFRNAANRVTTIVYEVKYHPEHMSLFKLSLI